MFVPSLERRLELADLMRWPWPAPGSLRRIWLASERLTELPGPLPHGLVAHDDAASGQHLLDYAQAEREPEIQPDCVADDLGREAVAGIRGASGRCHPARLPGPLSHGKPKRP